MTNSHLSRVSGVEKAVKQLEVRNANRPLDDTGPFGRLEWLGKPVCLSYPDACSCQLYVSKKSRRHGVAKLTIVPNVPSSRLCKRGTATAIERLDMQKTENDVSELSVSSGASLRLAAALVGILASPLTSISALGSPGLLSRAGTDLCFLLVGRHGK
jgi:hypothetical protein